MRLLLVTIGLGLGLLAADRPRTPAPVEVRFPSQIRLSPGERQQVTIELEGNLLLHQPVNLYFEEVKGIRVVPAHAQIMEGKRQTTVTLEAGPDAVPGERRLEVMAELETGRAVVRPIAVEVEAR